MQAEPEEKKSLVSLHNDPTVQHPQTSWLRPPLMPRAFLRCRRSSSSLRSCSMYLQVADPADIVLEACGGPGGPDLRRHWQAALI